MRASSRLFATKRLDVVDDQVVDRASGRRRAASARSSLALADARVPTLRDVSGTQVRIAVEREVQLVERRRLERGAGVRGDAQAVREVHAPGEAAGGVAAELFVVVAAHARLQRRARPKSPWYCANTGAVAARRRRRGEQHRTHRVRRVALPVEADRQQVACGDARRRPATRRCRACFRRSRANASSRDLAASGRGCGRADSVQRRARRVVLRLAADHLLRACSTRRAGRTSDRRRTRCGLRCAAPALRASVRRSA